jgi:hypothetical protein
VYSIDLVTGTILAFLYNSALGINFLSNSFLLQPATFEQFSGVIAIVAVAVTVSVNMQYDKVIDCVVSVSVQSSNAKYPPEPFEKSMRDIIKTARNN